MIVPWPHLLRSNWTLPTSWSPPTATMVRPVEVARAPRSDTTRAGAALALGLGFFGFLPYPALSIGNSSAVQVGNVLSIIACVPCLMMSWRRRPFWMLPMLLAPLVLSSVKAALSGSDNLDLSLKTVMLWTLSAFTLMAIQRVAPRYALQMLTGAAAATVLHVGIGLWQCYSFASGVFPFVELYVNKSFLSVQDHATSIARYTRRPFGLFPEPSAMAASLAPWLLFWAAELLGIVRLKVQPARWQRVLFGVASVGSIVLMILSQSGHAAITLAAAAVLAVSWFLKSRATARTYLTLVLVFCVVMPAALYFGAESIGERMKGKSSVGNSSWEERSDSLIIGFQMVTEGNWATVIFGYGTGLSAPGILERSGIEAVFSALLCYVYETGVVGAVVVCLLGAYVLRVWKAARFDVTFAAMLVVWMVGVTLTTSYEQLLPLWMTMGWLTVWTRICEPKEEKPRAAPRVVATYGYIRPIGALELEEEPELSRNRAPGRADERGKTWDR